jgi:hypothetical protein
MLLALANAVILRSKSCGTHDHILLSQIRDSPNLEGQVPVRNRVAGLYPQALGFLFFASYKSQGYGGGIPALTQKSKSYYDRRSVGQSVLE